MSEHIEVPIEPRKAENRLRCYISLSDRGVSIDFEPGVPDAPHKPSIVETMAAGALLGIAKALTGKGADDVIAAMARVERENKRRTRR